MEVIECNHICQCPVEVRHGHDTRQTIYMSLI